MIKLKADLSPYWTWNTKQIFVFLQAEYTTKMNKVNQVSLWDEIILSKAKAKATGSKFKQEYHFNDQGNNLRGRDLNLTLAWNVVPRVGMPSFLGELYVVNCAVTQEVELWRCMQFQ